MLREFGVISSFRSFLKRRYMLMKKLSTGNGYAVTVRMWAYCKRICAGNMLCQ
jgi:hypothetical protein